MEAVDSSRPRNISTKLHGVTSQKTEIFLYKALPAKLLALRSDNDFIFRIRGSHSGGYEEIYLLGYKSTESSEEHIFSIFRIEE
jgi:hypothetical protein